MVIALLTDFGTKDYFVGAMKGAILSINVDAKIVDITHEIAPQDLTAASFTLRACYENFPHKTIFVAVVDPGVGSDRKAVLAATDDYYFVAPDNGLLSFIYDEKRKFRVYELTEEKFFAEKISRTFHGRDVFAPVAAHISNGVQPNEFGKEIKDYIRLKTAAPHSRTEKQIEAEIVYADRFGNLVTNLKQSDLPEKFTLEVGEKVIGKLQIYFAEAEKGELFMIIGSAGFLEIVAFRDSAQSILRVAVGEKVRLTTN